MMKLEHNDGSLVMKLKDKKERLGLTFKTDI